MHFEFALKMSNIDLWNIDLVDTYLELLDTDISSKYFVCLHNVFKKSSRHVFKRSSRHVFKTSSRHVFKTSWRRLQQENFLSSKTSWRRLTRCFQDILEYVKLLRLRRVEYVFKTFLEDIFKTNKCLLGMK